MSTTKKIVNWGRTRMPELQGQCTIDHNYDGYVSMSDGGWNVIFQSLLYAAVFFSVAFMLPKSTGTATKHASISWQTALENVAIAVAFHLTATFSRVVTQRDDIPLYDLNDNMLNDVRWWEVFHKMYKLAHEENAYAWSSHAVSALAYFGSRLLLRSAHCPLQWV